MAPTILCQDMLGKGDYNNNILLLLQCEYLYASGSTIKKIKGKTYGIITVLFL